MTIPRMPGSSDHQHSRSSWPRRHKMLTAIGAIVALIVVGSIGRAVGGGHGSGGTHGNKTSGTEQPVVAGSTSPAPTASATAASRSPAVVASSPETAHKLRFPPRTLAQFRAFAATGNASQVHQVATNNEGLPSCPQPNIDVTVSRRLAVRMLEADLSAFFVQSGLISNSCGAVVFAFHSLHDYRANMDNGYTVGRVIITTNTGSSQQRNLEVDVGDVYNSPVEFAFNY